MSEERILRLENAMATLAELAANMQGRVTSIEEAYVTVVRLLRSHHDGITEMRAAQADADAKIAALADAQIRTEGVLAGAQIRAEEELSTSRAARADADAKIAALADAQIRAEGELSALRAGQADTDAKIAALADAQQRAGEHLQAALMRLAESQAHTDRRLDALIDIVRGGRGAQPES